jgi:Putative zinc- or iron-chelating domain
MHDVEPKPKFVASDSVVFLATHPRGAAMPTPAAPVAREKQTGTSPLPAANAYAKADRASYRHLETAAYYRALDAARSAAPDERIAAMARSVHALADEVWASVRAEAEPQGQRSQIACAAGCGACCHQLVALAPAEAVAIAWFVPQRFTEGERRDLADRIASLDAATRGKTASERARLRLPCAFLAEGRCLIYEARPLRCRAVHSRDAAHCGWVLVNPDAAARQRGARSDAAPYLVAPAKIMDAALTGLARACRSIGIDSESLELTAAARIALAVPDLDRHLGAGEPVFAAAALLAPAEPPETPPAGA